MRKMKFLASALVAAMLITSVPNTGLTIAKASLSETSNVVMNSDVITGYSGDAQSLTRMVIPDNAKVIETGAFYSDAFPNLVEMVIRNNSIEIKDKAFGYDSKGNLAGALVVWCNPGSTAEAYAKSIGATIKYLNNDNVVMIDRGDKNSTYYSGHGAFVLSATAAAADSSNKDTDLVWRIDDAAYNAGLVWFQEGNKRVQETSGTFIDNKDGTVSSQARVNVVETANMTDKIGQATITVDSRGNGASDSKTFLIMKATSTIRVKARVYKPVRDEKTKLVKVHGNKATGEFNMVVDQVREEELDADKMKVIAEKGDFIEVIGIMDEGNDTDYMSTIISTEGGLKWANKVYTYPSQLFDVDSDAVFQLEKGVEGVSLTSVVDRDGNVLSANINSMTYVVSRPANATPTVTVSSQNNTLSKSVSVDVSVPFESLKIMVNNSEVSRDGIFSGLSYIEQSSVVLGATVSPADSTYKPQWETSDAQVASVKGNALNMIRNGNAEITCKLVDSVTGNVVFGNKFYLSVMSKVRYSGIAFVSQDNEKEIITDYYLEKNDASYKVTCRDFKDGQIYTPGEDETAANETLGYNSSNTQVATVNNEGIVKPVGVGTAVITAYAQEHPEVKGTLTVHVYSRATGLQVQSDITVVKGQEKLVPYKLVPDTASEDVEWIVSNNDKAIAQDYVDDEGSRFVKITGKDVCTGLELAYQTIPTGIANKVTLNVEEAVHADSIDLKFTGDNHKIENEDGTDVYLIPMGQSISVEPKMISNSGKKVNDILRWVVEADQNVADVQVSQTNTLSVRAKANGEFWATVEAVGYGDNGAEIKKSTKVVFRVYTPATTVNILKGGSKADVFDVVYGSNLEFTSQTIPSNSTDRIKWSLEPVEGSDVDPSTIARLSLTDTEIGQTIILATTGTGQVKLVATADSGAKASTIINVYRPVKNVTFECNGNIYNPNGTIVVAAGTTKTITVKVADEITTDKKFTWSVKDAKGAIELITKEDGLSADVNAFIAGTTTTITVKGNSAASTNQFNINVKVVKPADELSIVNEKYDILKGNTANIYAELKCDDGTEAENIEDVIKWEIADENVATIVKVNDTKADRYVQIRAVNAGVTTITGTTLAGITKTATISVAAKDLSLSNETISMSINGNDVDSQGNCAYKVVYTGSEIVLNDNQLLIRVTEDNRTRNLKKGTDYDVTYENNLNVGKVKVIISALESSDFTGTIEAFFEITPKNLPNGGNSIEVVLPNKVYDGSAKKPSVKVVDVINGEEVVLVLGKDYEITKYMNNVNAGTAMVYISGLGNYSKIDNLYRQYVIERKDVNASNITASGIKNFTFNNNVQEQTSMVIKYGTKTLVKGTDYNIVYKDSKNNIVSPRAAGTYKIFINGMGVNYTGTKQVGTFKISARTISGSKAGVKYNKIDTQIYSGSAYKLIPASLRIKIGTQEVSLAQNTDYSITWNNSSDKTRCVKPGRVTVTIKGKGNYTGTISTSYVITPIEPTKLKVVSSTATSVKLSWSKAVGASGYKVYVQNGSKYKYLGSTTSNVYNATKLASGKDYSFKIVSYVKVGSKTYSTKREAFVFGGTRTGKPVITKLSSTSKTANITWKQLTGATTYKVYYATSAKGKYRLATTVSGNTASVTNLVPNRYYYFKVMAGRTANGKLVFGEYSTYKRVKIKK